MKAEDAIAMKYHLVQASEGIREFIRELSSARIYLDDSYSGSIEELLEIAEKAKNGLDRIRGENCG